MLLNKQSKPYNKSPGVALYGRESFPAILTAEERDRAGNGAYVLIRDLTCRLFGYDGLLHGGTAFSLDHMFGF
jgi:hypothetical protein